MPAVVRRRVGSIVRIITLGSAVFVILLAVNVLCRLRLFLKVPISDARGAKSCGFLLVILRLNPLYSLRIIFFSEIDLLLRVSRIVLLYGPGHGCKRAHFVLLVRIVLVISKGNLRLVLHRCLLMICLIHVIVLPAKWLTHTWFDPIKSLSLLDLLASLRQGKVRFAAWIVVKLN